LVCLVLSLIEKLVLILTFIKRLLGIRLSEIIIFLVDFIGLALKVKHLLRQGHDVFILGEVMNFRVLAFIFILVSKFVSEDTKIKCTNEGCHSKSFNNASQELDHKINVEGSYDVDSNLKQPKAADDIHISEVLLTSSLPLNNENLLNSSSKVGTTLEGVDIELVKSENYNSEKEV